MAKTGGVSVGNLTAYLGLDDGDFTRGIMRAQSTLTRLDSTMQSIGSAMTTFITLPLLALGSGAIKMGIDFEKAFTDIEGLVGVTRTQVAEFRQEVLRMSPEIARAPQELADALKFVTSSGFEGAEALDILEKSGKSAAAGLGETKDISDLVTAAINAYGKENLTASQTVDTLTAAVREGKAEGSDMAHALGFVMPIASEMGVEFEEAAAAVAAMTRVMKSGSGGASTAATNLRQVLSDLQDPSERARDAMEDMGTSASALRRAISEGGLLSVLTFFKQQLETNEEAMSSIFPNVKALTGALQLVGKNADEVQQVFANLGDSTGDMEKAFSIASQGAAFKFNQAMAHLKIAGIELGTALMPIFLDIVDGVRSLATWFTSLDAAGKRWAITIGAMAAAAGPLLIVLSSMVAILSAITIEVVAVVAGVAALAAGFIYLYENWEAVVERVSDWGWWKNMLLEMMIAMYKYNPFVLLTQLAIEQYNKLSQKTADMINNLIDIYNGLLAATGKSSGFLTWVTAADVEVEDPFAKATEGLEMLIDNTKEYKHEFKSFTDSIIDFAKKAKDAVFGIFPEMGTHGLKGAENPVRTDSKITSKPYAPPDYGDWESIDIRRPEESMKTLIDLAEQLEQALQNAVANGITVFAESLSDLFTGDIDAKSFFDAIMGIVADFLSSFGKALIAAGTAAITFEDLLGNPYAAVAAGIALIVAAGAVRSILKKGPAGRGGSSPTSNGVTMSSASSSREQKIEVQVQGRIRGYDLDIITDKNHYKRRRLG